MQFAEPRIAGFQVKAIPCPLTDALGNVPNFIASQRGEQIAIALQRLGVQMRLPQHEVANVALVVPDVPVGVLPQDFKNGDIAPEAHFFGLALGDEFGQIDPIRQL